jgi:hypothetical protein
VRWLALLIGLLGAGGSGFVGFGLKSNMEHEQPSYDSAHKVAERAAKGEQLSPSELGNLGDYNQNLGVEYDKTVSMKFLFAGAALGLIGAILSFGYRGKSGAALLIAAAIPPTLLNPKPIVFGFMAPLVMAGLIALFVRPRLTEPKIGDETEFVDD